MSFFFEPVEEINEGDKFKDGSSDSLKEGVFDEVSRASQEDKNFVPMLLILPTWLDTCLNNEGLGNLLSVLTKCSKRSCSLVKLIACTHFTKAVYSVAEYEQGEWALDRLRSYATHNMQYAVCSMQYATNITNTTDATVTTDMTDTTYTTGELARTREQERER